MEENDSINDTQINAQHASETFHSSISPNPAAIDINIMYITSPEMPYFCHATDPETSKLNSMKGTNEMNSENGNHSEKITHNNKNENLRKASCDINLFEIEDNPENYSKQASKIEDPSRKNSFEFTRECKNRPETIPLGEEINRGAYERFKKTIITENYKYIGETANGKCDGFGICEFIKGKICIGNWKNNMMQGLGKVLYANGDIEFAEFVNNEMCGYYECIKNNESIKIQSYVKHNKFTDFIIFEKNNKIIYEGEPQKDEQNKISFGKLTVKKNDNSKKLFIGNVKNYQSEIGFGMFFTKNFLFYAEIRNNILINYIETFTNDGSCFLGFLKDSKKNGLGINFWKDGRTCIGEYEEDLKKGPIFVFSYQPKNMVKMELYLFGFKTKTVEKIDTIKKYLNMNYPEYSHLAKKDFQKLFDKISPEIQREIADSQKLIEKFNE